jgi:crotonobetaine/carnitine-CoA ligase
MDMIGSATLTDVFERTCRAFPQKEFIVFEDSHGAVESVTYEQARRLVDSYAAMFVRHNIVWGTRVLVHMHNCPAWIFTWLACARLGAVMVPLNVLSGDFELDYCIEHTRGAAVVTEPEFFERFVELRKQHPCLHTIFLARTSSAQPGAVVIDAELDGAPQECSPESFSNDDDLMWLFTSGTTSRPKAVQLTHANAVFAGMFGAEWWKVTPDDRHMLVLPLFHVNAQFISVMPILTAGATLVMTAAFSASHYMEQVRRHRVTTTSLVATTLTMIMNQPAHALDARNDLRLVMYAIGLPREILIAFQERFNAPLCELWGMSETLGATTINPPDGDMRLNCIGIARRENQVKIVDDDGCDVLPGTVGEMVVRGIPGRTIMKGYYNDAAATAVTIRDNWLYTGDNARMDEQGYFYFIDRKKDMIKRAGENVAACEVEYVISLHPAVQEVAVVGVPDEVRDEAVLAFVIVRPGASCGASDVIDWCAGKLSAFKVPGAVRFVPDFPRTSLGKVQKNILKQQALNESLAGS